MTLVAHTCGHEVEMRHVMSVATRSREWEAGNAHAALVGFCGHDEGPPPPQIDQ
eukprot:CAMPEP_0170167712 /NCGR_PEP_ID=MMETSP0040_2-20121228/1039_1 /TAXON_ID=641309 /ORGANISM="Lotharella oceanica, Strain CCMP622" /LENGTH=53 /DNA_ID=CAMNT_0010405823 /DNA_START=224 /DNA_END=385 /DNA_ORIENTATION=+